MIEETVIKRSPIADAIENMSLGEFALFIVALGKQGELSHNKAVDETVVPRNGTSLRPEAASL